MFKTVINQPEMHISQAPIGKFLQRVSQSVVQSVDRSSDYSWPSPPSSAKENEREKLRVALGRLFSLAAKQQEAREASSFDETVRESLFQAVLGYDAQRRI